MNGSRAFRVAATGARVLTGAAVAAACVAGVVAATTAPWPEVQTSPAAVDVTPLPGDTVVVCGGDFRAIGRDVADPQKMVSAGAPRRTVDSTSAQVRTEQLTSSDLEGAGELSALVGEVEDRRAPLLGAAESLMLSSPDLTGLAAAPCGEPRTESWLVGGSVATGAEDVVTLTNPSEVAATVTLTVYGGEQSSSEVVVPARTQVALPLTSIAVGSPAPVIEVTAAGAPVRAMLQSALTRTLDPAGVDMQEAAASPQTHPVIAGVRVFPGVGADVDMTLLRLLSPEGDAEATVTVRPVGSSAGSPSTFVVPLSAGTPVEVSLDELPEGQYTVDVDADVPVLSAVRQQDGVGAGHDFAWVLPSPEIDAETLVAVPAGPAPRLVIAGSGAESTVTIAPLVGGEPREVTVPAEGAISVPLDQREVYTMRPSAPVHAAVELTAEGALAAWPVWPSAGAAQSITVYP